MKRNKFGDAFQVYDHQLIDYQVGPEAEVELVALIYGGKGDLSPEAEAPVCQLQAEEILVGR